jgi:hypothetical protein
LLGPGPRLIKKEFTGPRSHKKIENHCLHHALLYHMQAFKTSSYQNTVLCAVRFTSLLIWVLYFGYSLICVGAKVTNPLHPGVIKRDDINNIFIRTTSMLGICRTPADGDNRHLATP